MSRKNKTVSFDLTDSFEQDLLKYAESKEGKGKFSRYMKRLIVQDRDGGMRMHQVPVMVLDSVEENDSMSGFM